MELATKDVVELYVFRLNRLSTQYTHYEDKLEKAEKTEIKTYKDILIAQENYQGAKNTIKHIKTQINELQKQIDKLQYEV
jgi:predicted  nucleic acid-binding Zn-ribbon protein